MINAGALGILFCHLQNFAINIITKETKVDIFFFLAGGFFNHSFPSSFIETFQFHEAEFFAVRSWRDIQSHHRCFDQDGS